MPISNAIGEATNMIPKTSRSGANRVKKGSLGSKATRRIETDEGLKFIMDHPAFGMWADREDMKDPAAWLRKIRAVRYERLGIQRPKPQLSH